MARGPKPKIFPFNKVPGEFLGSGQDNAVYRLSEASNESSIKTPTGFVVKLSHDTSSEATRAKRRRSVDPIEAAKNGITYKKHKYDLLKHFLGDAIPQSFFVLGDAFDKGKKRPVEYTIQKEVPQYKLSDLNDSQKNDPRLQENMLKLISDMEHMYYIIGKTNARTSSHINLDAKLDLGGMSDYVRAEIIGKNRHASEEDVQHIINTNNSPNLLVDPDTLQPYCIDFDQGEWIEGMTEAKELAFELDKEFRNRPKKLGSFTVGSSLDGGQLTLFDSPDAH